MPVIGHNVGVALTPSNLATIKFNPPPPPTPKEKQKKQHYKNNNKEKTVHIKLNLLHPLNVQTKLYIMFMFSEAMYFVCTYGQGVIWFQVLLTKHENDNYPVLMSIFSH